MDKIEKKNNFCKFSCAGRTWSTKTKTNQSIKYTLLIRSKRSNFGCSSYIKIEYSTIYYELHIQLQYFGANFDCMRNTSQIKWEFSTTIFTTTKNDLETCMDWVFCVACIILAYWYFTNYWTVSIYSDE